MKKSDKILFLGVAAALLIVAAYFANLNIPRSFSLLYPECKEAELCTVVYIDENMASTTTNLEGQELAEFIARLNNNFKLYPYPQGKSNGSVILEGNKEWHLYFRTDGQPVTRSVTVTDRGYVAIGDNVYRIPDGTFSPLT